ncbi:MAG: DUF72 domain-containing protein [Gammaproteobacteria bacterium]|nr:DUF72 domain-containing protein [Gammaproteobacteria bacterium]
MPDNIFIGTSGWSYQHWKDSFYPHIAQKDWLGFYAEQFNSVEINGSFYRLQSPETYQHWYQATPADFRFSLKANRYLTHRKRLLEPEKSVALEKEHAQHLQNKLAVVLWQLPANFKKNIPRLKQFLLALANWPEVRHTIEFRHTSWFDDETIHLLKQHRIAICQSDAADWPLWNAVSGNVVYLRLHGHTQTYVSSYAKTSLVHWAKKIIDWQQQEKSIYVYFDNDAFGHAPQNAKALVHLLKTR